METISFSRKQLHEMIDAVPDDMTDEIFIEFKNVLVSYLAKSMMQGFVEKRADLQFIKDILDNGGPEKSTKVIRMPKITK